MNDTRTVDRAAGESAARHGAAVHIEALTKTYQARKGDDVRAVENGAARPNTMGRPGQIVEHDLGRTIGTNSSGNLTTKMRVVIILNAIRTGFPF